MIVLDTNVISEAMRDAADGRVVAWMDAQAIETLFITAITVAELRFGILALPPGKRREGLSERLDGRVLPVFAERILPFDLAASATYADLMATASREGQAIGREDGYIAAIARARGLSVATRDISPFQAAGVPVIDPWTSR